MMRIDEVAYRLPKHLPRDCPFNNVEHDGGRPSNDREGPGPDAV